MMDECSETSTFACLQHLTTLETLDLKLITIIEGDDIEVRAILVMHLSTAHRCSLPDLEVASAVLSKS